VVAEDIATDPLWAAAPTFRDLAIAHGLRACWSAPIRSAPGRVLGTFALYRTEPGSPAPEEHDTVQLLTHTAALVIEAERGRESTRRAKEAAERANRSKDEFLAMLGHELRTPLAPIVTALQLMALRERESPSTERAIIERQVKHLERLVDDLLDVSRITTGKIDLRREHVTVEEVVARAIELAQPLMVQRRHRFTTELQPGLVFYADPFRLAQVLGNLLVNAAKYTDPGGRVELVVKQRGDRVVIVVRDNGIGLAPDALASVFELFQQEGVAADPVTGGLGLGLAIVRSLVELHDGTARAQSEGLGKGSQFIVELPVATIESQAVTVPSPHPARAAPRRILVVDDNEDTADMMALVLSELGHTVRVATNGRGALEMLELYTPDVALLDIGLPDMDGYVLAERLRATRHGAKLILVAVTGYGQDSDRRRALGAGFDEHVVKPVDLGRLSELLERIGRAD
jgi:signal transduction histidine kinase